MTHYPAPVFVHTLQHALVTCPAGIRPLPVKDGGAEMRPVPVRIVVHDNGRTLTLDPSSFVVVQHVHANTDPEKGPLAPEQPAALVFHVRVPAGYMLVKEAEYLRIAPDRQMVILPPDLEDLEDGPAPTTGPREIPEFNGTDPAVFATNPEAVNRAMREIFAKGKTNKGANP